MWSSHKGSMANKFLQTLPLFVEPINESISNFTEVLFDERYIYVCLTILISPCYNFDNSMLQLWQLQVTTLTIPGYDCDNSCAKPDTPLRYKQSRVNMDEKVFSQCQSQKIHCSRFLQILFLSLCADNHDFKRHVCSRVANFLEQTILAITNLPLFIVIREVIK